MTPSIIFMPHLQNWLRQGYEQLRTVLLGALEALPLSVLLLVTSDVPRGQLQPAAEIFLVSCNNNAQPSPALCLDLAFDLAEMFSRLSNDLQSELSVVWAGRSRRWARAEHPADAAQRRGAAPCLPQGAGAGQHGGAAAEGDG